MGEIKIIQKHSVSIFIIYFPLLYVRYMNDIFWEEIILTI
ncbi:MAG: hypothetical protein KatS3mg027_1782 [Bacteroidia bacterium]|nr:MAG: hypothetical protein KatS3mg027_1782 [Bacteroidia bacterium]